GSAYKVTELLANNVTEAVITSSGNAVISLLTYLKEVQNFKLNIVLEPFTNKNKIELIQKLIKNSKHELFIQKNSKKFALRLSIQKNIPNLRSAIDNNILKGYWSLGFELY